MVRTDEQRKRDSEIVSKCRNAYGKMLPEMLKEHEGEYVAFIGGLDQPYNFYKSDVEALEKVIKSVGGVIPLFIQEVNKKYLNPPHCDTITIENPQF